MFAFTKTIEKRARAHTHTHTYRGWTQTGYLNKHYNINQKTKAHRTTEEEMEEPISFLRIQGTGIKPNPSWTWWWWWTIDALCRNHKLQCSLRYFLLNMPHFHVPSVQYYSKKCEITINPINNVPKFVRSLSATCTYLWYRPTCNDVQWWDDGKLAGWICLLLIREWSSTLLRLSDKASNYQDRFQCR